MLSTSFGPFPDVGAPDWFMKLNKASIRVNKEFSMSISPVVRKFVNTNQFNLTNSEFIDPNNFESQLNTSIGNMSTTNIYKNGENPLYIVDLHYDQTHPDIVSRLFNGKEVIFTRENQDFLMYLAQALKIKGLKRSLENFIKFGESQTVKDLREIGRLISEFSEETFDDVYNFLLKYLQSDDENTVKQSYFVAFVIFNGCVARPVRMELFIKLAQKLDVINEFTAVCIYNYKDKENLQESLFLLRHLYSIALEEANETDQIKNDYSLVRKSVPAQKKSLLFSDLYYDHQKETDPKDNNGPNNDSSDNEENENSKRKLKMLQIFSSCFTPIQLNSFDIHKEYAAEGINPDPIAKAVRNDDVSIFTDETKRNQKVINFSSYCVKPSLYERSTIINNSNEEVDGMDPLMKRGIKHTGVPLVCYAAYFGSIECFKYLVDELNVDIPANLTRYAICGGNSEIISFCQKRMRPLEDEKNAHTLSTTALLDNLFGSPIQNQDEKADIPNTEENQNMEENNNEFNEEENHDENQEWSEENNVCVFDTRCLELAAIYQRIDAFKLLVEILQIPITDSVINITIQHFSFEILVYILSKPGFDLNSLFLRSTKFSNEEAASLISEFCDSYGLQEEDTERTPLHYACEHGLSKVVKILIEKVKPGLRLKARFDDEKPQGEEEEIPEINPPEGNEVIIEEEEEELEGFVNREVQLDNDQNEQQEFDDEIQKAAEVVSSEQTLPTLNQNQEEEENNLVERNIDLNPEQENENEEQIDQQAEQIEQLDQQEGQFEQQQQELQEEEQQQQEEEQVADQQAEEFEPQEEQIEAEQQQQEQYEPEQQQQQEEEQQIEPEQQQQEEPEQQQEVEQQQEEPEQQQEVEQQQEEPEQQQEEQQIEPEQQQEEPEQQQEPEQQVEPEQQQEEEQAQLEADPEQEVQMAEQQEEDPNHQLEQIEHQEEVLSQEVDQIVQREEQQEEAMEAIAEQVDEQVAQIDQEVAAIEQQEDELNGADPSIQTREVHLEEEPAGAPNEEEEESTEIIINNHNEEEDNADVVLKNNSLMEGNNELDELEQVGGHPEEEEEVVVATDAFFNNRHEEEEEPLITFSPSTTDDDENEDEFINNISGAASPTASNLQLVERSFNMNSSYRSIVVNPASTVDFNARDTYNETPLQLACKEGWTDIVRMFAQLGLDDVDYEAVSDYEKTALMIAEEAGHVDIVKIIEAALAGKREEEEEIRLGEKTEEEEEIIIDQSDIEEEEIHPENVDGEEEAQLEQVHDDEAEGEPEIEEEAEAEAEE